MQRTFNIYFVDIDGTNNATTSPDIWVKSRHMPMAEYIANDMANHVGIRFYSTRKAALDAANHFIATGTIIDEPGTVQRSLAMPPKETPGENLDYCGILQERYDNLRCQLADDPAGHASTMLHPLRRHLDDLNAVRHFLCDHGLIDMDASVELGDGARDIADTIHGLLQKRLMWHAGMLDKSIAARKARGDDGGFTTAVILANAYNDIFDNQETKFTGESDDQGTKQD